MPDISKSNEDYLETIYNLLDRHEEASVKSIATYMNVSLPAVTGALKTLHEKGYVLYKSYEPVKLTKEGQKIAKEIIKRHITIRTFLHTVLKLNDIDADSEACALEHAMNPNTVQKLSVLMDKIKGDIHFKDLFVAEGESHLSDQKPGYKGKIKKITGAEDIKRRIIEMGLTTGTKIEIMRKAPLGDPIEIKARSFRVSLRHTEAFNIIVEG